MVSQEDIHAKLSYDPHTGIFTNRRTGKRAGTVNGEGYRIIQIKGTNYREHRLAFLFMLGKFPGRSAHIDHINKDRADNRWSNLRDTTPRQNQANKCNSSKYVGVTWTEQGTWLARLCVKGKNLYLGRYKTHLAASYARWAAELEHPEC